MSIKNLFRPSFYDSYVPISSFCFLPQKLCLPVVSRNFQRISIKTQFQHQEKGEKEINKIKKLAQEMGYYNLKALNWTVTTARQIFNSVLRLLSREPFISPTNSLPVFWKSSFPAFSVFHRETMKTRKAAATMLCAYLFKRFNEKRRCYCWRFIMGKHLS